MSDACERERPRRLAERGENIYLFVEEVFEVMVSEAKIVGLSSNQYVLIK